MQHLFYHQQFIFKKFNVSIRNVNVAFVIALTNKIPKIIHTVYSYFGIEPTFGY